MSDSDHKTYFTYLAKGVIRYATFEDEIEVLIYIYINIYIYLMHVNT